MRAGKSRVDLRGKDASQEITNNTADTVLSEDIEALINSKNKLELGGKVAADAADETKDKSRPGGDVTSTGGNGNETSNGTRAETNSAPLLLKTVIKENPSKTTSAGSKVGDNTGHGSTVVGGEGGATVEAEPANPQENSSENNVGDVVGAVRETLDLGVASALPEHESVGESGGTGADVDGGTTSKVETAHLEGPTLGVPGPEGNRVVDNGGPDEDEDVDREHASAISDTTNSECGAGNKLAAVLRKKEISKLG